MYDEDFLQNEGMGLFEHGTGILETGTTYTTLEKTTFDTKIRK